MYTTVCSVCPGDRLRLLLVLTNVCREGHFVDGRVKVDDIWRSFESVKVSCQPLHKTGTQSSAQNRAMQQKD